EGACNGCLWAHNGPSVTGCVLRISRPGGLANRYRSESVRHGRNMRPGDDLLVALYLIAVSRLSSGSCLQATLPEERERPRRPAGLPFKFRSGSCWSIGAHLVRNGKSPAQDVTPERGKRRASLWRERALRCGMHQGVAGAQVKLL